MILKKIFFVFLFMLCVSPAFIAHAQDSKSNSSETASSISIEGIENTIKDSTPEFVSKTISWIAEELENFRLNYWQKKYIFYPLFLLIVFLFIRWAWRLFFF